MFHLHKKVVSDGINDGLIECATYNPIGLSKAHWTSAVSDFLVAHCKILI